MKVLINGGGIGGYALAHFLKARGITPLVFEQAPSFRALGHIIALKSEGVAVLDRLGLREACARRAVASSAELIMHTQTGRRLRTETFNHMSAGLQGYLALRRSDLHACLHELVKDEVEIRFGTKAESWSEDQDGVTVVTSDGRRERADLLVGADGIHSFVRHELFGDDGVHRVGGSYIAIEVDCPPGLAPQALSVFMGRGRIVGVFPGGNGRVLGIVYHDQPGARQHVRSSGEARMFFAREYADFAPAVREMFAAIDRDSFVFADDIAMITLPSLYRGRVALLGDAAACPTFLSGMGSAFAMLSAERLAAALADKPLSDALTIYDTQSRAHAEALQKNARGLARFVFSKSRAVAFTRNALVQLTPEAVLMRRARKYYDRGVAEASAAAGPR